MTKTRIYGFFFFFLEFGFVGKQKGNEEQQKGKAYNLMQCDQKRRTGGVFFYFFWEFGFVGKQKGNEKQQKGKAYNLMQSDQKTRTGGVFFFFFFGIWFC